MKKVLAILLIACATSCQSMAYLLPTWAQWNALTNACARATAAIMGAGYTAWTWLSSPTVKSQISCHMDCFFPDKDALKDAFVAEVESRVGKDGAELVDAVLSWLINNSDDLGKGLDVAKNLESIMQKHAATCACDLREMLTHKQYRRELAKILKDYQYEFTEPEESFGNSTVRIGPEWGLPAELIED